MTIPKGVRVWHKTSYPYFYYERKPDIMDDVVEGYFLTDQELAARDREIAKAAFEAARNLLSAKFVRTSRGKGELYLIAKIEQYLKELDSDFDDYEKERDRE